MSAVATPLPARRPELLIRPLGENGQYVVKNPETGEFFHLGEQEHFLLEQFDGQRDAEQVCAAFEKRFGQPLGPEELDEFIRMAHREGLLRESNSDGASPAHGLQPLGVPRMGARRSLNPEAHSRKPSKQSLLYWRKKIFDPDRLFTWLEPKIRFFWTPAFLWFSAACMVLAAATFWLNRHEAATALRDAMRWETAVLVWLTLLLVTTLHEFAHGLTCKHHGGQVREIGFLMMFFMPCFYCNVSDAWLLKEKSKRLWVTFAGGYFELFLWALAVFVWRLALPGTLVHYLAFVVLSICGIQSLFNFNPLLKLDGYYLASDWLEIPNLQQRALGHFKGQLRRLLWGAPRPGDEPRGRLLLGFGLVTWLYSLTFLGLMLWGMFWFLRDKGSWLGMGAVAILGLVSSRALLQGVSAGEVRRMITKRRKRAMLWLLALGGLAAVLCLVEIEDRAGGTFQVRPTVRAELRAPVAGFLNKVYFDEGDRVSPGALVARLDVPDLASRLAAKQAEVTEAHAVLRLLEIGSRPEEVAEQRQRVARAEKWRDLAQHDLARLRQALEEDLARLEKQIAACQAERDAARNSFERAATLASRKALTIEQQEEGEAKYRISQARLEQAESEQRACEAKGTLEAETELARREKELPDAQAALALLVAGARPEQIEAQRARLARLEEERRYLAQLEDKLLVTAPVAGVVTTARLKERTGQYVAEGELIGVVEQPAALEVEITLAEQKVSRVRAGQAVALKARALPFETYHTKVARIAPGAARGDAHNPAQNNVIVYCRLDNHRAKLRPGMTGYARIYTGRRPLGEILLDRTLRFLRTEFWW